MTSAGKKQTQGVNGVIRLQGGPVPELHVGKCFFGKSEDNLRLPT